MSCFQVFVKENVQSSKISKVHRYNPKPLEAKIISEHRSNDLFNTKRTQKKICERSGLSQHDESVRQDEDSFNNTEPPKKRPTPKKAHHDPRTLAQAPCRTEGAAGDEIGRLEGQGHWMRCGKN